MYRFPIEITNAAAEETIFRTLSVLHRRCQATCRCVKNPNRSLVTNPVNLQKAGVFLILHRFSAIYEGCFL